MLYRGTSDRLKWLTDRLLRRAGRWMPALHRHAPVASVRLRDIAQPLFVRMGTSDWVVLEEIFRWNAYDALFAQALGQVATVVDLGANVGISVRLWQHAFPTAKIIAVEPDPANAIMLRRNIDAGPRPKDVTLIAACAAASTRNVWLDDSGGAWGVKMLDSERGKAVPAMTLPELLHTGGLTDGAPIDLLKCDIEGAEAEVFANCASWIQQIHWLAIELHPPYNKDRCLADLERNGARLVVRHAQGWVGQEVLVLERST